MTNLQSIFQLSVALNLGFLGFISLSGDALKREELLINDLSLLMEQSRNYIISDDVFLHRYNELKLEIERLQTDRISASQRIEAATYGWMRYVVLATAVASILLLFYSSLSSGDAGDWMGVVSILLFMPFVFMLGRISWLTKREAGVIRPQRDELDRRVTSLLEDCSPRTEQEGE
ncbi:hypothetical protein [Pinisolibacter sp.]|uniref:hypothetical protein n=1 Tax=Pinisolibacter sp. TaxID=2172024 RepID=UPI002FDCBC53